MYKGEDKRKGPTKKEATSLGQVEIVPVAQVFPHKLPLLPISQSTLFPGMVIPVILPEGKLTKTLDEAAKTGELLGVVLVKEGLNDASVATGPSTSITGIPVVGTFGPEGKKGEREKREEPFYRYGVVAKVLKRINLPDNQVSVLLSGLERFELKSILKEEPILIGQVEYIQETTQRDTELEALLRTVLTQFKALAKDNPLISEEVKVALVNIDGPSKLADFVASVFLRDVKDYQEFLSYADVKERLHQLLLVLKKEHEVQLVQKQISDKINQKVGGSQREFYLQEQLKLIQKELGRPDEKKGNQDKFLARLKGKEINAETKARIHEELGKLNSLNDHSSEYSIVNGYLDWLTSLPWGVFSPENLDLLRARKLLDREHFGLKDVKERILEFLAVKKLKGTPEGSIICLVGPPGTGKTSLGKSIAKTLGRKFFRFSVGGMRDEAEIKGHRRTYVGAMPGKIIQGLKRVNTQNPVFLIDEIDKIGTWSQTGDPASALLEVLDSEQNKEFLDHYLDVPFDCSKILFIATANSLDSIPSALLDRMEVIHLHSYTDKEKFSIAKKHLIPKQLEKNALVLGNISFSDRGLYHLIHRYAREAGVRNLEKQISKICRKEALRVASGNKRPLRLDSSQSIEKFLGLAPYQPEVDINKGVPGVATGLAWTSFGGEVLFVESRAVEGKAGFTLTGSLGEVMQESANIACTFIRAQAERLGLNKDYFDKHSVHLHVPAGATPKDGPSAGVTLAASLYSLFSHQPIKTGIAMTGELSLTGRVLPVGGIKEKLLAAKRSGFKTIILPRSNERDLKELDLDVKDGFHFKLVSSMDEVLKFLFL